MSAAKKEIPLTIDKRVINLLATELGIADKEQIRTDSTLYDLGAGENDAFLISEKLEEEFSIEFNDEDDKNIKAVDKITVSAIVKLVKEKTPN